MKKRLEVGGLGVVFDTTGYDFGTKKENGICTPTFKGNLGGSLKFERGESTPSRKVTGTELSGVLQGKRKSRYRVIGPFNEK